MNRKLFQNDICYEILFVFILALFIKQEIICGIVLIDVIINCIKYKKIYFGGNQIIPFFIIGILGVIMNFYTYNDVSNHSYIRFIYYVFLPILYFIFGNFMYLKYGGKNIIKTIFIAGTISLMFVIINLTLYIIKNGLSFDSFRFSKGLTNDLQLFIVIIYLFKEKNTKYFSLKIDSLIFYIDLLILLITFSRTNLLYLICVFFIYIIFYKKNLREFMKFIIISNFVILFILIICKYNNTFEKILESYINKITYSFEEISADNEWSVIEINHNWRGYEIYLAKQQFKNADLIQKVFGMGGRGVYAGRYKELVSSETVDSYLPLLHNGYFAVLVYSGIVGFCSYIYFFVSKIILSFEIYKKCKTTEAMQLLCISIGSMFTTYIVMGVISGNWTTLYTIIFMSILQNFCEEKMKLRS